MSDSRSGYTVVELVLTAVMMVPILMAFLSISQSVSGSLETNERSGEADELLQRTAAGVERLLRPALRASLEVRADASDVAAAIAAGTPVPTIGDWIPAPELSPRPGLRFTALHGVPTAPTSIATTTRALEFVLEPDELDNDLDDDGDGLVDEGTLWRNDGDADLELLRGVEICTFEIDDNLLRLTLQWGRSDPASERVVRSRCVHNIVIHN